MEDEIIAAIKANPNISLVSDQDVYNLIAPGGKLEADRTDILNALVEPRRSYMMEKLHGEVLKNEMQEEYQMIINRDGAGYTLEQLRTFVSKYKGTPQAAEIDLIINRRLKLEEEMRYQECDSLKKCHKFKEDYPTSSYKYEIEKKIQEFEMADDDAWHAIQQSHGDLLVNLATTYLANENYNRHTKEVETLKSQVEATKQEENELKEWQEAISKATRQGDAKLLSEFIHSNKHELFLSQIEPNMSVTRKQWAEQIIIDIDEYPTIQRKIDNVLNSSDSDVDNYVSLMEQYPMFEKYIHDWMLGDMKKNAWRYQRNEMFALLFGGELHFKETNMERIISPYFKTTELIENGILTETQIEWIRTHPNIQSDYDDVDLPIEDNFKVAPNTTDVYFFGISGCGKTAILAGLFNAQTIEENLSFKVLAHSDHKGFNYARTLTASLNKDLFPKSTPTQLQRLGISDTENTDNDDKFIQVIDATITERDEKNYHVHKISLIEMPGARTNELAQIGTNSNLDSLGHGAKELLQNDNSKIIFFVIDPKKTQNQTINIHGASVSIRQSDILDMVADLIIRMMDNNQIKNLKAVHVLMAKSDLLPDQTKETIQKVIDEGRYKQLMITLNKICHPSRGEVNIHCNRQPHIFTFSLGEIAPGDFVRYKDTDTKKILKVICGNTISVRSKNFWDTVMTWMN